MNAGEIGLYCGFHVGCEDSSYFCDFPHFGLTFDQFASHFYTYFWQSVTPVLNETWTDIVIKHKLAKS